MQMFDYDHAALDRATPHSGHFEHYVTEHIFDDVVLDFAAADRFGITFAAAPCQSFETARGIVDVEMSWASLKVAFNSSLSCLSRSHLQNLL